MAVQTAFRLEDDLSERMKSLSAEEGRTQTWYMNTALREYLDRNGKLKKQEVAVKKENIVRADSPAREILDYLNKVSGSSYKTVDSNLRLIEARLKNYSPQNCIDVIEKKCTEWKGTEWAKYLRPSTLFNATKFENYVNEKVIPHGNRPRQNTKETPEQRLSRLSREMEAKRTAFRDYGEVLGEDGSIVSTQMAQLSGSSY